MFCKFNILILLLVVVVEPNSTVLKSKGKYLNRLPGHQCPQGQIACASGQCISQYVLCDGIVNCPDYSDESAATCDSTICPWYMFRCTYGACVKISSICNGVYDCADGSDEYPMNNCVIPGTENYPQLTLPAYTTSKNTKPSTSYPTTLKTSTKNYTPFTPHSTIKTTEFTTLPTRPPTTIKTITTTTTTITKNSTHTPGSCQLPPQTPDRTYVINDCKPNSPPDPFCQRKSGEFVESGVALNFKCLRSSQSYRFMSTCLGGSWVPPVEDCKAASISSISSECGIFPEIFYANTHVTWQVGIFDRQNEPSNCGGVIVSPYVVISAAHCFYDSNQNWKRSTTEFYITTGKFAKNRKVVPLRTYNLTTIRFAVDSFQGVYSNFKNDIAVVEVEPEFQFDSETSAVCLDTSNDPFLDDNNKGMISLYNDNEGSGYTETARVTYASNQNCLQSVSNDWKSSVTSDKICLINRDVEIGNGGSGLYTLRPDGQTYRLRGVFSSSFQDAIVNGLVSTITDVFQHTWINDVIEDIHRKRRGLLPTSTTRLPDELNIDIRFPSKIASG